MNHKRTPALRYILQGSHANYFFERHIEHALGSDPTTAEKLAHRAIFTVQQLLRASHPVGIYQPLEVASEVVVHRITQVGRIRADYHQGNIYENDFMEVWNHRFKPYRDREWMKKDECADCKYFRFCKGNGMHLRDENGDLLFCHLKRLQTP